MLNKVRFLILPSLTLLLAACGPTPVPPTPPSATGLTFDKTSISVTLDVAQGTVQTLSLQNSSANPAAYEVIDEEYVAGAFVVVDELEATGTVPPTGSTQINVKIECPVDAGQFNTTLKVKSGDKIAELPVTTSCNAAPIPTIVQEDTKIVTPAIASEIISYNAETGTVTFATTSVYAAGLKEGDTVVSGSVTAAPEGFLRNVVAVRQEGGNIVVETEEAGLGDVFDQAEFQNTYEPTVEQISDIDVNFPGITAQTSDTGLKSQALVDFSFNEVLFDADSNSATTNDRFAVNGSVHIDKPKFDVDGGVDVKYRTLFKLFGKKAQVPSGVSVRFRSTVGVKETANLTAQGEVKFNKSKRIPIATIRYTPINFAIGPVPVSITHYMNIFIDVGADLSVRLNYQASQSVTMKYGFEYKNDALRTISEKTNTYGQTLDLAGNLSAWAYPGIRYNAKLYGGPGMFAEVRIGAKLSASVNVTEALWKAELCGDGTIGMTKWKIIDIKILGYGFKKELPEKSSRIFDFCQRLREGRIVLPIQVLPGTGPEFKTETKYTVSESTRPVVTGDFNKDGQVDVVTGGANISVLLGKGDGTFLPAISANYNRFSDAVTAGDMNGDGQLDLIVATGYSYSVDVLLGTGDGSFSQSGTYYLGGVGMSSVKVGDVNRDGRLDVIVGGNGTVGVLMGKGDGNLSSWVSLYSNITGESYFDVITGDFNSDGRLDIAGANPKLSKMIVLLGKSDGTFMPAVEYALNGTTTAPGKSFVIAGDLSGDGRPDLMVGGTDKVSVLLGKSDGTFLSPVTYAINGNNSSLLFGSITDLNLDGRLDLIVGNKSALTISVLLGKGDGTFLSKVEYVTGDLPSAVATADLNSDGRPDFITAYDKNYIEVRLQQ
jgi:hypothetical protein